MSAILEHRLLQTLHKLMVCSCSTCGVKFPFNLSSPKRSMSIPPGMVLEY
jgi:hypothetical protein